jgi:hypothetical protein
VLVAITQGQEHAALASLPALAAVARAEQATVRLAYFRHLPAPRVDAHDRVVASVEVEMERRRWFASVRPAGRSGSKPRRWRRTS